MRIQQQNNLPMFTDIFFPYFLQMICNDFEHLQIVPWNNYT